jgi:4-amino-4-deoxy-L-arabinose transferase-like glycosyltransferase
MRLADLFTGLNRRLALVVDALGDPRRQHRTAAALIVLYVVLWWAYAVIAKSTQGIHHDMGEQFAWSQHPAFGYPKHPPFSAWLVALWFAIFPRADWAYYLLAVATVGAGLWFIWLIVARAVTGGDKRAVALMFLTFAPIFNFQPLKYNPNSVLIPVWAAAAWLFLRAMQERTLFWGLLAGVGAGVAMLTKYWSIFLILALIAAALADPRRRLYFRSAAPWASVVAGAVLLAPNVASLIAYNFEPFAYATGTHATHTVSGALVAVAGYLSGVLYLAGSFVALALAARPDVKIWRDMLWPHDGDRRLMGIVTAVSLLAPIAVGLALEEGVRPLWTMPCWAMLPAMLLASPRVTVTRRAACAVVAAAYAVGLLSLAAAPAVARLTLQHGVDHSAIYYQLVAREVDRLWPKVSNKPLAYITGAEGLAWACGFYCQDRPRALPGFSFRQAPWIDRADMTRKGFIALCASADRRCLEQAHAFVGGNGQVSERVVQLTRRAYGAASAPRRFTFIVSPPRQP